MSDDATVANGSLIHRLRERRQRELAKKTLTLKVPGWDDMLYIRYQPLEWRELAGIAQKTTDDLSSALKANIQTVISACDAILVKTDDRPEPESLADLLRAEGEDVTGEIRFDEKLKEVLDLEGDRASHYVLAVFGQAVSPELAIGGHANQLGEWMTGASEDVDKGLLGE